MNAFFAVEQYVSKNIKFSKITLYISCYSTFILNNSKIIIKTTPKVINISAMLKMSNGNFNMKIYKIRNCICKYPVKTFPKHLPKSLKASTSLALLILTSKKI